MVFSQASYDKLKKENYHLHKHVERLQAELDALKQTHESTSFRENEFQITMQSIGDAVIVTDRQGYVKWMNPIAENLTDWSCQDAKGKALDLVFQIFNAITGNPAVNPVKKVMQTGNIVGLANHTKLISKNGEEYQISDSGSPIIDDNNNVLGVVLVFRDVTEEYELQEAIVESEKRYRTVFENTGTATVILEKDGTISLANNKFAELSGDSVENIVNKKKWMEYVLPEDLDRMIQQHNLRREKRDEALRTYEFRFINKQGDIKHIQLHIDLIPDTDKSVASLQDVTALKETQNALKVNAERWNFALQGAGDGVWDWDLKNNTIFFSDQWKRQLGYEPNEIENKLSEWESRVHPDDIEEANAALKECLDLKKIEYVNEHRLKSKQGNYKWILDRGKVVAFDKNGKPSRFIGTHTDITQRKQNEIELKTTFFGIENASIGIYQVLDDGMIKYANQAACNKLGYSKNELIGMSLFNIDKSFTPTQFKKHRQAIYKADGKTFITAHTRKDGSSFPVEITVSYTEINGEKMAFSFVKDIIERIQSEKALRDNEEKYRLLVENQSDLIVKVDTEGKFLFVSPSYCKMFGKTEKELLGNAFMPLVHEDDRQSTEDAMKQLYQEPYHVKIEQRAFTVNGWRWISWSDTAVLDENGELKEIVGIGRDITEKKQAEILLGEQERRLSSLVDNLPGYVYRCDFDDNWTMRFISQQCESITGYAPDVFLNNQIKAYNDIILPEFQKKVAEDWKIAVNSQSVYEGEYQIRTKQKQIKWVWERGIGVYDANGKLTCLEGYVEDISATKVLIEDLTVSKDKAEESDRLKTAFLANMSHEIRTPMNGILGFTNLLLEPQLTGDQVREYVDIIQKSGTRMLNTVNDIITISRIETGQVEISKSNVNLAEEINDICKMLRPEAIEKGVQLNVHFDAFCTGKMVNIDRTKFDSVMTNLIKNAIKFTDQGQIDVSCSKAEENFHFEVKDTGCGIPENRLSVIFDRFIQGDIDDKRALQGSGLGLAISKSYVEMLGGELHVDSVLDKGSRFHFTIPENNNKPSEIVKSSENSVQMKPNLKILIVEDDTASVKYLNVILKDIAQCIQVVTNGQEAIDLLKNQEDIDLILMDIKLPVMNGYDATREIRKINKDIVIIAQTAYAIAGDREKAIAAGCNDYIAKPIVKKNLLDLLIKYF